MNTGTWAALPLLGSLYLSGLFGLLQWPPPSLKAYSTIIKVTGIDGPEGAMIRIACALFGLACWMAPWGALRKIGYFPATMCALLIALSFSDTGQGFAFGAWSVPVIYGCVALAKG